MSAGVTNTISTHPADHRVELEYSRQIFSLLLLFFVLFLEIVSSINRG